MKTIGNIIGKSVWALMLAALLSAPAAASGAEQGKAEIKFNETAHNFGTIREDGGPVSCEFEFENVGDKNLVIVDARAECGCTRPAYPQNPIAPGKKGKVTVTYHPIGRPGGFDKTVTVKTNGKPSKVRLKIKGTVMPKSK